MSPISPMWAPPPSKQQEPGYRFTLTDYVGAGEEENPAGPSNLPYTSYNDPAPLSAISSHSGGTSRGGVNRKLEFPEPAPLRIHQAANSNEPSSMSMSSRPLPPSSSSSSSREISSPSSPSGIRPLPSIPRSFDQHDIESGEGEKPERAVSPELEEEGIEESEKPVYEDTKYKPPMLRRGTSDAKNIGGRFIPRSWPCRLLLITIIFETAVDLAIEGNILWRFNEQINSTDNTTLETNYGHKMVVYLILFILAHLWQLVLTLIALATKNTIQIIAVTIFNFAFLGYAIIQIYELRQILGDLTTSLNGNPRSLLTLPLNILTALIIAVIASCCVVLCVLAFLIRKEFGWQRYKFLGADLQIRKYYQRFQVFECICYFSAFFCAGFGVLFLWLALDPQDDKTEYILTWIMFILSLLILIMGRFAAKYENKPFMGFFGIGLLLGLAYFIFKLVRIWQQRTSVYLAVTKSLTVFDVLSMISLISCLVWGVMVYRDFGKGLKIAVLSRPGTLATFFRPTRREASEETTESELSAMQKRLTIS